LGELNPNDMRAHLLRYCLDPARVVRAEKEVEHLFESELERDVFRLIVARGYAVRPQVRVSKHRIDLVVEELRSRLAVECDGDRWHGVEKWEEDQLRQMVLERAGWTFWRVRGSVFYLNPEKALLPLWKKLEEMGIEPSNRIENI
jgi:very-short-patch-repair endonuclease